MEDASELSDWPSQPSDLSGSNPWLPAYGFQQPAHAFLDKDDFLGNPDADLFLHGGAPQYVYLETIQEETSDDLRSESDVSESRTSPVGWLATDSESGSVIRIQTIEDADCESDREAACPPKRRRHDPLLLPPCSDDDSSQSLSRSSSLLQFENLEKQCQDNVSSSSPSLFSAFSYDSLERDRRTAVSPDSLDQTTQNSDDDEYSRKRLDWRCRRYTLLKSFDASFDGEGGGASSGFGWDSSNSDTETETDCRIPYGELNGTTKSIEGGNSPDRDGEGHCLVVKIGGGGGNEFGDARVPAEDFYKNAIFTNNNEENKTYLHVAKIAADDQIYQNGDGDENDDCFCRNYQQDCVSGDLQRCGNVQHPSERYFAGIASDDCRNAATELCNGKNKSAADEFSRGMSEAGRRNHKNNPAAPFISNSNDSNVQNHDFAAAGFFHAGRNIEGKTRCPEFLLGNNELHDSVINSAGFSPQDEKQYAAGLKYHPAGFFRDENTEHSQPAGFTNKLVQNSTHPTDGAAGNHPAGLPQTTKISICGCWTKENDSKGKGFYSAGFSYRGRNSSKSEDESAGFSQTASVCTGDCRDQPEDANNSAGFAQNYIFYDSPGFSRYSMKNVDDPAEKNRAGFSNHSRNFDDSVQNSKIMDVHPAGFSQHPFPSADEHFHDSAGLFHENLQRSRNCIFWSQQDDNFDDTAGIAKENNSAGLSHRGIPEENSSAGIDSSIKISCNGDKSPAKSIPYSRNHSFDVAKVRGRCSSRTRKVRVGEQQDGRNSRETEEAESEYYKSLKIDVPVKRAGKVHHHRDEGEEVLRTWRSYEGVQQQGRRGRASVENLSEDSGYGEIARTSSIPNMVVVQQERIYPEQDRSLYKTKVQIGTWGFKAYDGEASYGFRGNFGVSYHDLSAVECGGGGVLVERFLRNARGRAGRGGAAVNLDAASSSSSAPAAAAGGDANFSGGATSASEPDLLSACADQRRDDYLISSVPKDLDICTWGAGPERSPEEDTDHPDMPKLSRYQRAEYGDKITIRLKYDTSSYSSSSDADAPPPKPARISNPDASAGSYRREGSYQEAMANSIDMSDDERKRATKRMSLNEKQMLKSISEQSVKSAEHQEATTDPKTIFASTPISSRNVISTPNLAQLGKDGEFERKSSLVNRDAVSVSTLTAAKSYGGSASSKGVTFSPVVAEVNWRDDNTTSSDRDSSYSLSSTTPERETPPRLPVFNADRSGGAPTPPSRISASHPELDIMKKRSDDGAATRNERRDKEGADAFRSHNSERVLKMNEEAEERVAAALRASKSQPTLKTERGEEKWGKRPVGGGGEGGGAVVAAGAATKSSGRTVAAMEEPRRAPTTTTKQNKIGGFFSRLASFRFSARKNEKNKKAKGGEEAAVTTATAAAGQRLATKDDYIYIPLKTPPPAPPAVKTNEVRGKPPLPKLPPRVVGACAKGGGARAAEKSASGVIDCGLAPRRPMEPMGLIETDLDTEVTVITSNGVHVKTRSLMNLGAGEVEAALDADAGDHHHRPGRPHKSMEFLLDKQNLKVVEPPENELQKGGERVMSEHQLRVQRSLQKLNVPDWYKQNQVPREGFLLRKASGAAAAAARESRWQGTASSKTTSLSSLGGGASSAHSPVVLSPTTYSQPFVRWSTSKLNSTASSPCASTRSSFNARQPNGSISPSSLRGSFNYRQPYLGWRSQERLSRPRTPAERLANSLLSQAPAAQPQESPEIQTSIKEVTSAIVHYVSGLRPDEGQDQQERSRSSSPRGSQRLCWLESSFVGTRPLDSPQTPVTLTESPAPIPVPPTTLRLDLQTHNDLGALSSGGGGGSRKPSPSSATLEDVLDSLLGLPSSTRAPSPSLQETASASTSPVLLGERCRTRVAEQYRRRSEGSEPNARPSPAASRRASLNAAPPELKCRYTRCGKSAPAGTANGVAFKNCHNCSYTYCSRTCRRAHWEKHRKTCLFSRVGSLCRQVIAAAKEQEDTLHQLSVIARRGYLSQGMGAVKIFFPRPEAAEKFLGEGLGSLGEPTYVRWTDLLPSEMGPQLYAELVRMCKSYNPNGKLVLYVSVCVVSEAPAAGAVKWERQLVSRCGKMRLSRTVHVPDRDSENPETLILTSPPITEEPVLRSRAATFANIQKHLARRGVSLKHQYPDIYKKLSSYADGTTAKFVPVTLYPKDSDTGKTFMCIIMPDVEAESVDKVETAGVRVRTVNVLMKTENECQNRAQQF